MFLDYLSEVDRFAINQALVLTGSTFPDSLKERLMEIVSAFNCRQVPTPGALRQTLLQVSKWLGLYLRIILVFQKKPFWSSKVADDVRAFGVCPQLLALLLEPIFSNKPEATVFGQYVGRASS